MYAARQRQEEKKKSEESVQRTLSTFALVASFFPTPVYQPTPPHAPAAIVSLLLTRRPPPLSILSTLPSPLLLKRSEARRHGCARSMAALPHPLAWPVPIEPPHCWQLSQQCRLACIVYAAALGRDALRCVALDNRTDSSYRSREAEGAGVGTLNLNLKPPSPSIEC